MKMTWKVIYNIFKYGIKILHLTRTIISNILLLTLLIISIGIYIYTQNKSIPSNNSALILNLTGIVVDKPITYNKFQKISKNLLNINKSDVQENSLFDIVNILRKAKHDPNIIGIILLLKNFSGGSQSSLEYIGKALSEFKKSGKIIYAISDYYSQPQYLLASYANKIYLTSQGYVDLRGLSTNKLYYKSCLNNLKINTHVFRVGEYKSAIEPFTRDNMSEKVRHEENIWVHQLWNQYLKIIATNRNITIQQAFPGIDNMLTGLQKIQGDTATYALQNKWVDEVLSSLLIEKKMKKIFGINQTNASFNAISMYDYNIKEESKQYNDQIAIICVQGIITDGINDISGSIGGNTIVNKIRNARNDPNIKSIIIRIDSPGGSVTASELIRLEIMETRNSGKPIVVSMGNVAASGGYWISTPANYIIASKSTITGSIGVFGIINTFEKTLDAIGIHSDGIDTSPISNISMTKNLSIEFKNMMQLYVDSSYQYFIKTVTDSRKIIGDINQIAQGHIWVGTDALKYGLIDKIGDFDDALNKAAELAGLTKYQLNWYDEKLNWIDSILQQINKIIYYSICQLNNHHTLFIDFYKFLNMNHNETAKKIIWNDPKNCYAFCFDVMQYNLI